MASNINLKITADVQQAVSNITNVNVKLEQMGKTAVSASERITRTAASFSAITQAASIVFSAIQKVVNVTSELVSVYSVQEQAEIRLQATLKATQNACGMSATELFKLADSLSNVTTYSDQTIMAVEQLLASAKTIGSETIPDATEAVLDMAAALGEDAVSAARRMAKVLADPKSNLDALKDANIQLTQAQKNQITELQEQNRLYEAQQIVLGAVESTYGGIAQSIAGTDTGKLEQLKNAWKDLKEGLGEMLMSSLDGVLSYTLSLVERIEGFISEHNANRNAANLAERILAGESINYGSLTERELEWAIKNSTYGQWLSEYERSYDPRSEGSYEDNRRRAFLNAVNAGVLSSQDANIYTALIQEQERRARRTGRTPIALPQSSAEVASTNTGTPTSNPLEEFLSANGRNSVAYQIEQISKKITEAENLLKSAAGTDATFLEEIIKDYTEQRDKLLNPKVENPIDSFLNSNSSLSVIKQIDDINEKIREATKLQSELTENNAAFNYLDEIKTALFKQKQALMEVEEQNEDTATSWVEAWQDVEGIVNSISSATFSLVDSFSSLMDTFARNAEDALDDVIDKWGEYFDELEEKQDNQRDSLNALLASGNISYGDYIDSMNALDEERAEARKNQEKEEEDARSKANNYGRAAFMAEQANAIAQATMSTAQAVMNVWADSTLPTWAKWTMSALVGTTGAVQIGTIAAQQYTPLASGGIAYGPTHALIGEGGSPELVMPLTDSNMERVGLAPTEGGGVININISIGASYNGDQLAEDVFRGIERAQRTGALPNWRYA